MWRDEVGIMVAFGKDPYFCYLPANEIASSLATPKAMALPAIHAFTGCDNVSSFVRKGKKTAWDVWQVYPEVTAAFTEMSSSVMGLSDETMKIFEHFLIILYERTSEFSELTEARKHLFTKKGRHRTESLPPTKAALTEHARRAAYQSGHIWGQALVPQMNLPDPGKCGWAKDEKGWHPYWTMLPEASKR